MEDSIEYKPSTSGTQGTALLKPLSSFADGDSITIDGVTVTFVDSSKFKNEMYKNNMIPLGTSDAANIQNIVDFISRELKGTANYDVSVSPYNSAHLLFTEKVAGSRNVASDFNWYDPPKVSQANLATMPAVQKMTDSSGTNWWDTNIAISANNFKGLQDGDTIYFGGKTFTIQKDDPTQDAVKINGDLTPLNSNTDLVNYTLTSASTAVTNLIIFLTHGRLRRLIPSG